MRREIRFEPGYDYRHDEDPKKRQNGCHGLQLRFLVHGDKGSVQFLLMTDWLPTWKSIAEGGRVSRGSFGPLPGDLGYHADEPQYEGQSAMECSERPGKKCYYDGSSLNADEPFRILVTAGDKALWEFLEQYYRDVFHRSKQ